MLSRASMMMTSLETLKNSFALYIKLFGESVSMDIGVRHEVAISTVILEPEEITLRSAASTLLRRASLVTARCEALGTM
jgi:hypothetical protein